MPARSTSADLPVDTVFFGDARRMADVPDNSVHLVVTSPPYFNVKDYSMDGWQLRRVGEREAGQIGDIADYSAYLRRTLEVLRECARVLTPNGKLALNAPLMPVPKNGRVPHMRQILNIAGDLERAILSELPQMRLLDTYIWNRTNPQKPPMFGSYPYPRNFYAQNTVEFLTVYVKDGAPARLSDDSKKASILTKKEWLTFTRQVWDIPVPGRGDPAYGEHSALMPEEMARRCVRLFSAAGDVVLDPFAGSGTTLKAAGELGRRFIGYEIMENYRSVIEKKLGGADAVAFARSEIDEKGATKINNSELLNKIARADCMDFLAQTADDSVDLAVLDPPYGMGKGEWDSFRSHAEFMRFTRNWIGALLPKIRDGGAVYIFNTPYNCAFILSHLAECGMTFQNWITWDKRDGVASAKRRFVPNQEALLFFTKGRARVFNADAVRLPYDSPGRIAHASRMGIPKNGKRWFPNPGGKLCGDVWRITSERHKRKVNGKTRTLGHCTVKPLEMIERIIKASSNPGDVVLDCFVGSGTTALAARGLGRNFLCCDSSPAYAKMAAERLGESAPPEKEGGHAPSPEEISLLSGS